MTAIDEVSRAGTAPATRTGAHAARLQLTRVTALSRLWEAFLMNVPLVL